MKNGFVMHLLVALVWMFLSGNTTMGNFFTAMAITFLLLWLFEKPIGCEDYVRRMRAFAVFIAHLIRDILISNLRVTQVALGRNASDVEGFFVYYSIEGLTDFEKLLLSMCVGLSPGTIVADCSPDKRFIILHIFAIGNADDIHAKIDRSLKFGILSFTR